MTLFIRIAAGADSGAFEISWTAVPACQGGVGKEDLVYPVWDRRHRKEGILAAVDCKQRVRIPNCWGTGQGYPHGRDQSASPAFGCSISCCAGGRVWLRWTMSVAVKLRIGLIGGRDSGSENGPVAVSRCESARMRRKYRVLRGDVMWLSVLIRSRNGGSGPRAQEQNSQAA